jgi:cytochrome c-type biogenesis protein CcsB
MQFAGTLILVFAAAIGTATFIENDYGTMAARSVVYDARWFEGLLLLTAISLIGSVFKYKLYERKRYNVLVFHFAFIIMLAGAAITRYAGYEGTMMIREGESSNKIISEDPYVQVTVEKNGNQANFSDDYLFTEFKKNHFDKTYKFSGESFRIEFQKYIPGAEDAIVMNLTYNGQTKEISVPGGKDMIGEPVKTSLGGADFSLSYGSKIIQLPFSIKLRDFQLERYPGSQSPSSFASEVTVIDPLKNIEKPYRIFMNNILNYGGFRFFQSSYDKDEKGTVLSVNHDKWGTIVTYIGYILMALGLIYNFFSKNSRFRKLARISTELQKKSTLASIGLLMALGLVSMTSIAQHGMLPDPQKISKEHAARFGQLIVQDQEGGRMMPVNTLASELLRKISRKENMMGMNSEQILLGMLINPAYWETVPMIKVSDKGLKDKIGVNGNYASFDDFIDQDMGTYKLADIVDAAYNKKPVQRTSLDKDVIKVDERVNVFYMAISGDFLTVFPEKSHPENKWHNAKDPYTVFDSTDAGFVSNILPVYYQSVIKAMKSNNWAEADSTLGYLKTFQTRYGAKVMPPELKTRLEITYNNINIFKRLFPFYGAIGIIFIIVLFTQVLSQKVNLKWIIRALIWLIIAGFVLHTIGLVIRWYVAGHAPWSNGYETMIYIAWGTVLSGIIFSGKSKITLATTAILASVTLMVANLSWLDPQVTNLVPVLKSYWLVIHVAVITASYSFLGVGALLGFLNLILISLQNKNNFEKLKHTIAELTNINEMNLYIGVFLVTIGTFLGAVWANESWGRYWGWDPKETWALVTVLVYSFIIHMRLIPGMKGVFGFNFAALIGFSSVLMTYFGVNYYLSGMHSYAAGDPIPIPTFVYYTVAVVAIVSLLSYLNHLKMKKIA